MPVSVPAFRIAIARCRRMPLRVPSSYLPLSMKLHSILFRLPLPLHEAASQLISRTWKTRCIGIVSLFGYPRRSMKPRHNLSLQFKRRIAWVSQFLSGFPVSRRSPIAIPFCVSRHSMKPNCDSFLRLQTFREAKSQFVFAFPDTPGSKIAIHFGLPETPGSEIVIHFGLPETP